jgi:acetylglutamate kinase
MMMNSFKKFYRNLFKGKLFIIKAGGEIITDPKARENLIANVQEMTDDGIKILLIYGGGKAIDEAMTEAGLTPKKVDGRRISSETDIKVIKKVLAGDLGFKLSESLVKAKLPSNVFNALPPHWATAKRRPKHEGITRFDGTLDTINGKAIREHFTATNLAVFPCLAFTKQGTALNINADNVAIELATKTKANKLILMTNIDGVMVDGKVASVLTAREIEQLIKDKIVTDGMRVKLENCINALRSGVKRVHILNGFRKDSLRQEVYTSTGTGTMIVREKEKNIYMKQEVEK